MQLWHTHFYHMIDETKRTNNSIRNFLNSSLIDKNKQTIFLVNNSTIFSIFFVLFFLLLMVTNFPFVIYELKTHHLNNIRTKPNRKKRNLPKLKWYWNKRKSHRSIKRITYCGENNQPSTQQFNETKTKKSNTEAEVVSVGLLKETFDI